jgi:hypothetical protein
MANSIVDRLLDSRVIFGVVVYGALLGSFISPACTIVLLLILIDKIVDKILTFLKKEQTEGLIEQVDKLAKEVNTINTVLAFKSAMGKGK